MKRNRNPAKEQRPKHWFYMAYCAVAITVLALITIIVGTALILLKTVSFPGTTKDQTHNHVYFGTHLDRWTGWSVLIVGFCVSIVGYFVYKFALIRIDRYNDSFNGKHSRFTNAERSSYLMK